MVGKLTIISGNMFSGKSSEVLRIIKRAKIARQSVISFKPEIDNRYSDNSIVTHDGNSVKAIIIKKSSDMLDYIKDEDLISADELQFMDLDIIEVFNYLLKKGHNIVGAGLDLDAFEQPFGPMPFLMAMADYVTKLSAICSVCFSEASRSQRLVDRQPVRNSNQQILVDGKNSYRAVCRTCYYL